MKKMMFATKWLAVATLASAVSTGFAATILYDNSSNDSGFGYEIKPGQEVGDGVIFDAYRFGNMGMYQLNSFSFQYHAYHVTGGGVTNYSLASTDPRVTIRLYMNDSGDLGSSSGLERPGSMIWSGQTPAGFLVGTNRDTIWAGTAYGDWTYGSNPILTGTNFTWTVELTGTWNDANDHFGLDVFGPSTVGLNYSSFWEKSPATGGLWQTRTDTNALDWSFAARIDAVPEPATVWLLGLGGLFSLGFIRRSLRRK